MNNWNNTGEREEGEKKRERGMGGRWKGMLT